MAAVAAVAAVAARVPRMYVVDSVVVAALAAVTAVAAAATRMSASAAVAAVAVRVPRMNIVDSVVMADGAAVAAFCAVQPSVHPFPKPCSASKIARSRPSRVAASQRAAQDSSSDCRHSVISVAFTEAHWAGTARPTCRFCAAASGAKSASASSSAIPPCRVAPVELAARVNVF